MMHSTDISLEGDNLFQSQKTLLSLITYHESRFGTHSPADLTHHAILRHAGICYKQIVAARFQGNCLLDQWRNQIAAAQGFTYWHFHIVQ